MKSLYVIVLCLLLQNSIMGQCQIDNTIFTNVVFFDDFEGTELNQNEWYEWGEQQDPDPRCQGNIQFDPDLNLVKVEEGLLKLYVEKGPMNSCGSVWSGSAIESRVAYPRMTNLYPEDYMIFEARAKMPKGIDVFPAFWIFSPCNEIDIFEYHDDNGFKHFTNTVHKYIPNCDEGRPSCSRKWSLPGLDEEFHNYAVAWRLKKGEEDVVQFTFFFDGRELWTEDVYQVEKGVGIILNNSIWHYSTQDGPETPLAVEWVKVTETNTKNIADLKKEYFEPLSLNTNCNIKPNSIAVGLDNQIFFNENSWMANYYHTAGQWNAGYIVDSWNQNERIYGDIEVNKDRIYYKGMDNLLHYYQFDQPTWNWLHVIVNTSDNVSDSWGSIATHHPSTSRSEVAVSIDKPSAGFPPIIKGFVHLYSGSGNTLQQLGNQRLHACNGDIQFLGVQRIVYRGDDGFLHLYSNGDGWGHSWILDPSGNKIPVRNQAGSILTTPLDTSQMWIVDPNGWIATIFWDYSINNWNFDYLTTSFNQNEVVNSLSNIIMVNDNIAKIIYSNSNNQLRYYEHTGLQPNGWTSGIVSQCSGLPISTPHNNLVSGAGNIFFYKDMDHKIRSVHWRCCETLNGCDEYSIIFRSPEVSTNTFNTYKVLPNPVSTALKVEPINPEDDYNIEIINSIGQKISSITQYRGEEISVATLPKGIYYLVIFKNGTFKEVLHFVTI